jgi:hypothetical protein
VAPKGSRLSEQHKARIAASLTGKKRSAQFRRDRAEDVRNGVSGYRLSRKCRFRDRRSRLFNMRSTWEVEFARYLDRNGVDWDYEPFVFSFPDGTTYLPDFVSYETVYEVKGQLGGKEQRLGKLLASVGYEFVLCDRRYLRSLGIRLNRVRPTRSKVTRTDLCDRFDRRVSKLGECWVWEGPMFFRAFGTAYYPQRFSYQRHVGSVPRGKLVYRTCGNVKWVNPEHLAVGTQADIVACTERGGRGNHLTGALHPMYVHGRRVRGCS